MLAHEPREYSEYEHWEDHQKPDDGQSFGRSEFRAEADYE
jgi:hypothetical protein